MEKKANQPGVAFDALGEVGCTMDAQGFHVANDWFIRELSISGPKGDMHFEFSMGLTGEEITPELEKQVKTQAYLHNGLPLKGPMDGFLPNQHEAYKILPRAVAKAISGSTGKRVAVRNPMLLSLLETMKIDTVDLMAPQLECPALWKLETFFGRGNPICPLHTEIARKNPNAVKCAKYKTAMLWKWVEAQQQRLLACSEDRIDG